MIPARSHPGPGLWSPPIDLYQTSDSYEIYAELPGVSADDVEVLVRERSVVIRGVKHRPVQGLSADSVEIETGHFRRVIHLPEAVTAETSSASLRDGLLVIHLPRPGPRRVIVPVSVHGPPDAGRDGDETPLEIDRGDGR